MQYKVGTVTTNGTNQVTGSGTAWLTNAAIGDLFWIQGQNAPYYIGNVNSDTLITLTSVFAGPSLAGQNYVIARSFTANQKFPYPESTDIDTHTIVKRAMTMIDTMVGAAIGASGLANRVVFTDANGNLTTSTNLGYNGSALTMNGVTGGNSISFGTSVPNEKRIIAIYQSGNVFSGIGMGSDARLRIAGDGSSLVGCEVGTYSIDGAYTWREYARFASGGNYLSGNDGGFVQLKLGHTNQSSYWEMGRDNATTGDFRLRPAGSSADVFRITAAGLVGVNTVATGRFHVIAGASDPQCGFFVHPTQANDVLSVWNQATAGNNVFETFYTEGSVTSRGSITYNRGGGVVAFNTTSGADLKNIFDDAGAGSRVAAKSIGILRAARMREYAWKEDPTQKRHIGPVADELIKVITGAVTEQPEKTFMRGPLFMQRLPAKKLIDRTAFINHLVVGWQQHDADIQSIKQHIGLN